MSVTDELEALLASALGELALDGGPEVSKAFVAPGAVVAWDTCCGGQLWVRVVKMHPVNPFPSKALDQVPCQYPLGMQIGLGLIRCQSGIGNLDQMADPSEEALTGDARQMLCDAGALYRALVCDEGLLVDQWTPLGPQGGCYGGEWLAWLGEFDLPHCGEESEAS